MCNLLHVYCASGLQMFVASKIGAQASPTCLPRVGVSRLRRFLERRVEDCYRRNVARIVPLLQHEMSKAEGRLLTTEREVREGKELTISISKFCGPRVTEVSAHLSEVSLREKSGSTCICSFVDCSGLIGRKRDRCLLEKVIRNAVFHASRMTSDSEVISFG